MKKRHSHLPSSLNGLKVFESAARHLSFTRAAEELNVTQSAVSRQIRQLEEHLEFPLFIRHHRALELSAPGKEISLLLTRQYSELNKNISQHKIQQNGSLRVKVAMSFAVRWLIPRLHSFKALYPELDIILLSSLGYNNEDFKLENDNYDIAIYNMPNALINHDQQKIIRNEYLAPVYSALLTKNERPISINELLAFPRLHPSPDKSDWKTWLNRNGRGDQINQAGLTFNTLDMALTSCFAGQGVAITDLMLVVHELKQGYLKLPQHATIVTSSSWEYIYQTTVESDAVTNFIEWLVNEQRIEEAELLAMAEDHDWQIIT